MDKKKEVALLKHFIEKQLNRLLILAEEEGNLNESMKSEINGKLMISRECFNRLSNLVLNNETEEI